MKIPMDLLALAYELRCEGCSWKRIAIGLSCDWRELKDIVRNVELGGLVDVRTVVTDAELELAHIMRTNSRLSWNAIGRYLGHSSVTMRSAYSRRLRHA